MAPGVLFVNFGGPQRAEELVPFLTALFEDVLPLPDPVRRFAAARISARRAPRVLPNYAEIGWSPLVPMTERQLQAVVASLGDDAPPAAMGMMYCEPTVDAAIGHLLSQGVDGLVALALFPHFSLATTACAYARVAESVARRSPGLPVHYVPGFFDHALYVQAVANTVREAVASIPGEGPIHLLFSPHGLPVSFVRRRDPYPNQVRESARRVVDYLQWTGPWHVGWQSRVGPVRWLEPSTDDELIRLGAEGAKRVVVVPISFVGDHIETLHEIDIEYAEVAHKAGIPHFARARALDVEPAFVACLADLVRSASADLGAYRCVRCLVPKPDTHRQRRKCPSCGFRTPAYLASTPGTASS